MEGYLFQLIENDVKALYWSPIDIKDELIKIAYQDCLDNTEDDFDDYWNENNKNIKIERIFVNEVII